MSPMMNRIISWVEFSFFEGPWSSHSYPPWPVSYPGNTQGRLLGSTFLKRLGQLILVWGSSDAALRPRVVVLFLMLGTRDMSNGETVFEVPGEHFGVSETSSTGIERVPIFAPTKPKKDGRYHM
ncbi:hypothetical protein AVEN_125359-1 [Araneus ventricosus]|uniref:Uncharacterized protein n=1 Tax=Araneus ventricosus TaxID=182803 RepID=A0A4Y2MSV8_ARAVE|nr:hypothetical protein AVEN_125359-1 [Araneus ventricosus]